MCRTCLSQIYRSIRDARLFFLILGIVAAVLLYTGWVRLRLLHLVPDSQVDRCRQARGATPFQPCPNLPTHLDRCVLSLAHQQLHWGQVVPDLSLGILINQASRPRITPLVCKIRECPWLMVMCYNLQDNESCIVLGRWEIHLMAWVGGIEPWPAAIILIGTIGDAVHIPIRWLQGQKVVKLQWWLVTTAVMVLRM